MNEQRGLFPTPDGLSREQVWRLADLADAAAGTELSDLIEQVEAHTIDARRAHATNRLVNVCFAEAICNVYRKIVDDWDEISAEGHYWLRGAMRYFVSCDDDEPDFQSAIGFEDDSEVLNACLRMIRRHDLCLNPEDFDDAN